MLIGGGHCICSDLNGPSSEAEDLHQKYGCGERVVYEAIDATNIPEKYNGFFDIIVFKSILGGVGSYENIENEEKLAKAVLNALKPGGSVLFCENMMGCSLHMYLRNKFRSYGTRWHYQSVENIKKLFSEYILVDCDFKGFLGTFGLNEGMRNILGYIDTVMFDWIIPCKYKYIGFFHYKKV